VDLFNKIYTQKGNIGQYAAESHGYFTFPKLEGEIGPHMFFNGKKVLNWSLNNYLGLANDPIIRKIDIEAAKKWGLAYPMGARMMSGHTFLHEKLEQELARFVKKEDAFLLNYGYQGMVSLIDALVGRHDVIVYDSESHACIVDGVRLHLGKRFVFPHNDEGNLKKELERAKKWTEKSGGGILVITEGVFGMAGDLGHLDRIVELKKKYKFRLLVDDAHGLGTMGKTGAGTLEHYDVEDEVDIHFSTFAKAMAGIGAFIACKNDVTTYLRYTMRSQTFAKSLPMPMVEGMIKRLNILRSHPELKTKLWTIANTLQNGLKNEGFNIGLTQSPVTPVYLSGSVNEGTQVIRDMRENYSIFCSMVIYPVIPRGQLIIRLIPTAMHTLQDVERTINAFKTIRKKLKNKEYKDEFAKVL